MAANKTKLEISPALGMIFELFKWLWWRFRTQGSHLDHSQYHWINSYLHIFKMAANLIDLGTFQALGMIFE